MTKKLLLLSLAGVCAALVFGAGYARDRGRDAGSGSRQGLTRLDGRSGSGLAGRGAAPKLAVVDRDGGAAGASELEKATTLLSLAARAERPEALTLLRRVLALDLPDTKAGRRVKSTVHFRLAGLYDVERKRRYHLDAAAASAVTDAQRRRAMPPDAGHSLVDIATIATAPRPTVETSDQCSAARSAGAFTRPGQRLGVQALDLDADGPGWFAFTVAPDTDGAGLALRAETFSDTPGSLADDTVLELWSVCGAGGQGLIGFADDDGGNAPLTSRLETGCLAPGTYYLEVRGFDDGADADGIGLELQAVAACAMPAPDGFEPDDDRDHATEIKLKSRPAHVPQMHGPARAVVQEHSVYPAGDEDWMRFDLKRDTLVRLRTGCGFPTADNDFEPCDNPPELDTILELYYASQTTTFGLCNQTARPDDEPGLVDGRIGNACETDLDCDTDGDGLVWPEDPDDLQNPFPGLPACLPWEVFGEPPVDPVDNPLAFSDDAMFPADLGADLTVCLPSTRKRSGSSSVAADPDDDFAWYVRVGGWSPDGDVANSTLTFDYALSVEPLGDCRFETEPNGALPGDGDDDDDDDGRPERLRLGESVHGIFDFSATRPDPDNDLYRFDVSEPTAVLFEIDGFDPIAVDTFIELVVGPDDEGNFYLTGDSNDDAGVADLRSRLEVFLPPACEMLGNCQPDAPGPESSAESAYYLNVTSAFVVPNFPYELKTTVLESVLGEPEDFGECGSGSEAPFGVGQRYLAAFDEPCDYDGYKFSLEESTFVRLATGPAGADTVLQLSDCETGEVLACDDDSGPGFQSALEGCLPGGREYCVSVRAWDGAATFDYAIEASGGEACEAEDPPAITATGSSKCDTFDTCP